MAQTSDSSNTFLQSLRVRASKVLLYLSIYLSTYSSGFFFWNKITLMLIIHFKSIYKQLFSEYECHFFKKLIFQFKSNVFWIRMSFFQKADFSIQIKCFLNTNAIFSKSWFFNLNQLFSEYECHFFNKKKQFNFIWASILLSK
jgi:hypothetical protein